MQQYMVVERFRPGCTEAVYDRLDTRGRMLPEGLHYLGSWVNQRRGVCYQLMETDDPDSLGVWTRRWEDLIDFEITPVEPAPYSRDL